MKWVLKNGSSLFEVSIKYDYINYKINKIVKK